MKLQFSISPDFNADQLPPWFLFNTWLQRTLEREIHFEPHGDFDALRRAVSEGEVDLVYANSYDITYLVRERDFVAVAAPRNHSDEALVAVAADSPVRRIADLSSPLKVAATEAPDVERVCRMLLEPAEIERERIEILRRPNYVLVAKELLAGTVDAAFFLERSFDELSQLVRGRMHTLVASRIYVLRHALLLSPRAAELRAPLLSALVDLGSTERGRRLLADLGCDGGWEEMTPEQADFMVDLMDTLAD